MPQRSTEKPANLGEYREWLQDQLSVDPSELNPSHYNRIATWMKQAVERSTVWRELLVKLPDFADTYRAQNGYELLTAPSLSLQVKPFDSFLDKTFRKNILHNSNWPAPPEDHWLLPVNWHTRINDIIRTLITVKYLDGVEFITQSITALCKTQHATCCSHLEAKTEGYYAAHLYITLCCEIPNRHFDTKALEMSLEVQVTTQLQEVIRRLLHKYYEDTRLLLTPDPTTWQWNYRDARFAANYLGHILHYVEGMIMDIREKQQRKASL